MATSTFTSMRPFGQRLFGDEASSLRSFRANGMSSGNSASGKASSLKAAKVFSSLGSSRNPDSSPSKLGGAATSKGLNKQQSMLTVREKGVDLTSVPKNTTSTTTRNGDPEKRPDSPGPLQRPRSKSRTILRLITTKFTSRPSPDSSSSPVAPPAAPPRTSLRMPPGVNSNFISKESREAALRERGLLPPLRPSKDLSRLEMEQDALLPITSPVNSEFLDARSSSETAAMSAASLIKSEWEAKNRASEQEQRQRLNSFKFGGASPTSTVPTSSIPAENPPSPSETGVETAAEASEAKSARSRSSSIRGDASHSPTSAQPPPPPPKLKRHPVPPALEIKSGNQTAASESAPQTPSKSKLDARLVPLPASPSPTSRSPTKLTPVRRDGSIGSPPPSPASVPLPASPEPSSPGSPRSRRSTASGSGTHTPMPSNPMVNSGSLATPAQPPVISLTPPARASSSLESARDEARIRSSHDRSHSIPTQPSLSESASSIMTPSLEASSSQSTTLSMPATVDSLSSLGKGKSPGLKVKTQEHAHSGNIPMIMESPVEEAYVSPMHDDSIVDSLGVIAEEEVHAKPTPQTRPRGLTESAIKGKPDRRKSMNPFKRGQTLSGQPPSSDAPAPPPKRLSVSASLSNLRRSVVGSVSRPKSTIEVGGSSASKFFNASHLPPSPTMPLTPGKDANENLPSFGSVGDRARASSRQGTVPGTNSRTTGVGPRTTGTGPRPRQAVAPTLHSRGSILMETAHIEDDESRRMTELAFLG